MTILKKNFLTYYKNLHKHKNNNFNIYNLDKIQTKKIKLLKNEIKDIYTDCYYFYKKRKIKFRKYKI